MKRTVTIFLLLFLSAVSLFAQQNLVPNGSFEEYSECPEERENHNGQFERAIGWKNPTMGTPDYIHRCNNFISGPLQGEVGVPSNFAGSQEPYEGDGYVLVFAVSWFTDVSILEGSEYIQCKLKEKLKPCYRYKFSMFVSLADNSNIAVKSIGAYFSPSFNSNTTGFLDFSPQIVSNSYLTDTSDWIKIEGDFTSKGNEEYLTIGYFSEDIESIDSLYLYSTIYDDQNVHAAIYYIDSISLYELENVEDCNFDFPNVFTPNNDGVNDVYSVDFLAGEEEFEFVILNRWGNLITTLNKDNLSWDGTTNGKKCTDGVYFYKYIIKKTDGTALTGNGTIHLMR